ncbi:MAG TPA: HAD-IC family P-type ATPase [Solirubrobacteraceae bacterium]|nr:HAD-IC family P-type ATPase [Solirubrobacteraceae bacterium]
MRPQTSRSYASIVRANALTIPNVILVVFGILTLAFDSWRDALFLGIVVANIAIGSFQEIRSKRELDRLAALVAPEAVVLREGNEVRVPVEDVVVGDAVRVAAGDQIVADGTLASADGLAVDESNLTGESKLVLRNQGDPVWSGTFAVEGSGVFEAKAVGADSRAEKLTATARTFRHPRSPLERANDRLLVGLVVLSLPLAVGLTASVLTRVRSGTAQVQAIVAGLANLIPEGLILLLSITAAVSAYRFARRGVLAQQLNAIESLASVDTLCTDKTGTLTEPKLRVVTLVPAAGVGGDSLRRELARYAASSPSRNATLDAIADASLADVGASEVVKQVSFSSRRRWSALDLGDERLVLGAPEWFADADHALSTRARQEANEGRRVLAIGRSPSPLTTDHSEPQFPLGVQPIGLAVLAERLRPNTRDTVAFFASQRVDLKVLSGDAPATVASIAHDAGVPGSAPALDGEALPGDPEDLRRAVLSAPAVGRISPEGKRAVIDALTDGGRYVGMLGDGVNDVGALKDARLGIAQGSGTQIARSVADLVLVQDDFAVVPPMVAEGRQILRNVQRVAKLFLTKTAFTAVLGLVVGITTATYPLLPRQFTLAATVTIGVPAFVLALAPSTGPWRPEHFLSSVTRFAVTAGVPIGLGIATGYFLARYGFHTGLAHARTVATATVVVCGLAVVLQIESECAGRRRRIAVAGLSALMALLFALALVIPLLRRFYELRPPTLASAGAWLIGSAVGVGGMVVALRLFSSWVHGIGRADSQAAKSDHADVA